MTSKMIALKVLDLVFIGATTLILLGITGLPMEWLLTFAEMSLREFQWFGLFLVIGAIPLVGGLVKVAVTLIGIGVLVATRGAGLVPARRQLPRADDA